MAFEFATAGRVHFGAGVLALAGGIAREHGTRALLVTGRGAERAAPLASQLRAHGVAAALFSVAGEPTIDTARAGVAAARAAGAEVIVGFGGGSALDAAKAIAALLGNGGDPLDYLEVVGRGRPIERPAWPFLAIPTTAGTGAEVTRNAVLAVPEARLKASLRSRSMLPAAALVDPELLVGAPRPVLAASGMDALSQLVEPLTSARANPLSDALARDGIRRSARSLLRLCDGADGEAGAAAREDVALASLLGGLCLANAGLGAVHGFAAPLGGMFDAPHGAVCAALLAPVMEANVAALRRRAPGSAALARYDEVARLLLDRAGATADDGVAWVRAQREALGIPPLRRWGLTAEEIPALVERARAASSMRANPIVLTDEELHGVARAALGG